jgi:DUF971 family protein
MLKQFKRSGIDSVLLTWNDDHQGPVRLTTLRDRCPCAGCSGEHILLRKYVPPPPDRSAPGRYELHSAQPVGNYALKLTWGDGHAEGLYTWDHLRSLCECPECSARRGIASSKET